MMALGDIAAPKSPRQAAKAAGCATYFTGTPCKAGHICERDVAEKKCLECRRERSRRVYHADRPRWRAIQKSYYEANKERLRAAADAYTKEHREEAVARVKRWRKANPEQLKAQRTTRKARMKGASGRIDGNTIKELMRLQRGKCAGCQISLKDGSHLDHIIALAKGGKHERRNLQFLCVPCNLRKNDSDPIVWAQREGRLL